MKQRARQARVSTKKKKHPWQPRTPAPCCVTPFLRFTSEENLTRRGPGHGLLLTHMGMRACRTFEGTDEVVSGVDLDAVQNRTEKLNIREGDFVDHRWSYLGGDVVYYVSNICHTLLMPSRRRQNILMKSGIFSKVCQNDKNVPNKPGWYEVTTACTSSPRPP